MDDETATALEGARIAIEALTEAINLLNLNQLAMHKNIVRLSARLAAHEAVTALEQMDEPRIVN